MKLRSFKLWLNIFTIIALVALIYFSRNQISKTFRGFVDLNLFWMAFIIPLQLLNYFSAAKFYQSYLLTLGEKVNFNTLYKVALEMNFVNNVFPSGGVSGFGYLTTRLRKEGVPASKSTLTQVTRYSLTFLSFIFYLGLALFLLSVFGAASRLMVLISTVIISMVLVGAGLLIYLISSQKRITAFTAFLPNLFNRVVGVFRRQKKQTIDVERIERLFTNLHEDYLHVKRNRRALKAPFFWTMLMNFTEIATIFVVYLAFGETINPGAIIIAYAVANIAGLVSVLPGGVGVYEGLMAAVLASAGVPRGLAISVTLVYRVTNMVLFLPVGFVLYQLALRKKTAEPVVER